MDNICHMQKLYGWGFPVDISTHGASIDRLIIIIHVLMAGLFAGWFLYLVIALVRFRARPGHRAVTADSHFKLPTYLEVVIAVIEILLLFVFSIPLVRQVRAAQVGPGAVEIRVVAEQFAWNVHYPGPDGVFGRTDPKLVNTTNPLGLDPADPAGADDITTINQLHIPVDTPVRVELSSKDVIHCFSIPVMRVKQDAIPGHRVPISFQATRTGDYQVACAQLCGLGHYRMAGFFTVHTADEFKTWLAEQAANKNA